MFTIPNPAKSNSLAFVVGEVAPVPGLDEPPCAWAVRSRGLIVFKPLYSYIASHGCLLVPEKLAVTVLACPATFLA